MRLGGGICVDQDPSGMNLVVNRTLERERRQQQQEREMFEHQREEWRIERQQLLNQMEQLQIQADMPVNCRDACRANCGLGV